MKIFRPGSLSLCLVYILGCSAQPVLAQHALPPEVWIEMRKMNRENAPPTTIEEEIASLAGHDARLAGPRLIDRGPEAMPAIHEALLAPEQDPGLILRLQQIIQTLSDHGSIPVLLRFLRHNQASPLRGKALLTLAFLPADEEAGDYVTRIAAERSEPWPTRRMAFTWFGLHRNPGGRAFAEKMVNDPDPEKQAAALYVLARLGDRTMIEPITALLTDGPPANSRDVLLISLAELVSPEEFEKRAPSSLAWSKGYRSSLLYARYLHAEQGERPAFCLDMLDSSLPEHLGLAVRCLLESGQADDLRPFAALNLEVSGRDALVRDEIRKAGWHIVDTEEKFEIVPGGQ